MKPFLDKIKNIFLPESFTGDKLFRACFAWSSLVMLLLMLPMSTQVGLNGDERFHLVQSKHILDFYTSFGEDQSINTEVPGVVPQYYGSFFEFFNAVFNVALGNELSEFDPGFQAVRHMLISIFGWVAMLFCGLLAAYLGGWRAGLIALIFIFLSPRFLGHSFFNVKDLPFTTGFIIAVYFIVKFIRELPLTKMTTMAGIVAGTAIAMNMRVGGLILLAFLGLFLAVFAAYHWLYGDKDMIRHNFNRVSFRVAGVFIGAYFSGLLFWPYGLMDPINHPFEALTHLTNFHANITVLFGGEHIKSTEVPWNYIPQWMLISIPLQVLIGFFLFIGLFFFLRKHFNTGSMLAVFFTAVFPIFYVNYKESNLYDGWRHLIFVYPSLVVLAALTWEYFFRVVRKKAFRYVLAGGLVLFLAEPLVWTVQAHPNAYVYFNPLIGGIQGAYGKYETDYYMTSLKQSAQWLVENELKKRDDVDEVITVSNCSYPVRAYVKQDFKNATVKYMRFYERAKNEWDYALFFTRFANKSQLLSGAWPPKKTLHTVTVRGVPLSAVIYRENNSDFKGYQALKKKQNQQAINYFKDAVAYDPANEGAYTGLAQAQLRMGNNRAAINALQKSLRNYPDHATALNMLGAAYLKEKMFDRAILTFSDLVKKEPGFAMAYNNLGIAYASKGNADAAIPYFKKAITIQPGLKQAYLYLAQIYKQQGNDQEAQRYSQAAAKIGK